MICSLYKLHRSNSVLATWLLALLISQSITGNCNAQWYPSPGYSEIDSGYGSAGNGKGSTRIESLWSLPGSWAEPTLIAPENLSGPPPIYIPPPAPNSKPQEPVKKPSRLAQLENKAASAIAKKQWRTAERALLGMLEIQPDHREATSALANILLANERTRNAINFLQPRMQQYFAQDAPMLRLFGRALLQSDQLESALCTLHYANWLEPALEDINLLLGIAYLKDERPLTASTYLCSGRNSSSETFQQQQLTYATALAQLGQTKTADSILLGLSHTPANQELGKAAWANHTELLQEVYRANRFYGTMKTTIRYDDNTGIVPTTNEFGTVGDEIESAGTLGLVSMNYDLWRHYQATVTTGYQGLFTRNFKDLASQFDVTDHAAYLAGSYRTITPEKSLPCALTLRADYNDTATSGTSFLQRAGVAAGINVKDSDYTLASLGYRYVDLEFLNQAAGIEGTQFDPDSQAYEVAIERHWQNLERTTTWQLGYILNKNIAEGSQADYLGHRAIGSMSYLMDNDSFVSCNLQYFFRNYDNLQFATGSTREDSEILFGATYARLLWDDAYLVAEYFYDINDSDSPTSSYHRNVIEVGLQWNFASGTRQQDQR